MPMMQGAMFPNRPVPQPGMATMQGGMPSNMGGTGQMTAPPVSLTTAMQPPSAPMPGGGMPMPGAGMQNLFGQMGQPLPGGMGQLPGPSTMGPRNMGPGNMGGGAMTMPGRGVVQPNQMTQAGAMQQMRQGGFAPPRPVNDPTFNTAMRPGYTPAPQASAAEGTVTVPPGTPTYRPMDGKGQALAQQRQGAASQQEGQGGSPLPRKPMAKKPGRKPRASGEADMQSLASQMYGPTRPAAR